MGTVAEGLGATLFTFPLATIAVKSFAFIECLVVLSVVGCDNTNSPSTGTLPWERLSGLTSGATCLLASDSAIYAAGVSYGISTDNGMTWTIDSLPTSARYPLTIACTNGYTFVAGEGIGVYRSGNGGTTWQSSASGLTALKNSVTVLAVLDSTLFAGTEESGVFCSTNDGNSWAPANVGLASPIITSLLVRSQAVYAAALPAIVPGTGYLAGGVFRTTDDGLSWAPVCNGLSDSSVYALTAAGADIFAATPSGIFISPNSGGSWQNIAPSVISTHVASDGTGIYALVASGILKSSDEGMHWVSFGGELPYSDASGPAVSFTLNNQYLFISIGSLALRHKL